MGEALAAEGPFPVRRIRLDDYLDDFFFDPSYNHLIGAARDAQGRANAGVAQDARLTPANGNSGQVVNLLVGRKIADIAAAGPAASRQRYQLGAQRHHGAGHAQPQGGRGVGDRHEDLEGDQAHRHPRAGVLHALAREHALCLGRQHDEPEEGHHRHHRQADARRGEDARRRRPARPPPMSSSRATVATRW
ncbi:MAG: hypothetical protein MZU91_01140 [Desulfosudis oleivorans]|nr:hypothetical protein [Desulfosudis oleivorans]